MMVPPSIHEFQLRDRVVRDGMPGVVLDALALYACIRWEDGTTEEIEQLDPDIFVESRGGEVYDD